MRNSASKHLIQKERDGLSPIPVSLHQAGVPLPASLLTQRVCSSTISTSDANDPMAIISMLFLFVKQLAFIVARSLKTAQEGVVTDAQSFFRAFPPTLPGVPPCSIWQRSTLPGDFSCLNPAQRAAEKILTKYNVARSSKTTRE